MPPNRVHLGTLELRTDPDAAGPSAVLPDDAWSPLDITFLEDGTWEPDEGDKIDVLSRCLTDLSLDAACDFQRRGSSVFVRVAIQPNDYHLWKLSKARSKLLFQLFGLLHRFWNGGGEKIIRDSDEELGIDIQGAYALLDSPPEPRFGDGEFLGDHDVFTALTNYDNPVGVNTLMYKYQIRSVARMLRMESQPSMLVDPTYTPFTDAATGDAFYVDMKTMNIIHHPDRYPLSKGGILCEQMGVGKTLICLALVLASRHQPTQPPNDSENVTEVYTDVALREYSTASAFAMRDAVDMCADLVALHNPGVRYTCPWALTPASEALLDRRTSVYYRFPPPVRLPRGAKMVPQFLPERFLLAQTTLVVVPQILVAQWLSEAELHLDDGALRIFTLGNKQKLPRVEELIKYDIVLLTVEQFSIEGRKAADELYETELMKARWKRIILDEGVHANNLASNTMLLAKALSIERRWIVSGTPTTRLKQGTEDAERCFLESEGVQLSPSKASSRGSSRRRGPSLWSTRDSDDVLRIGRMLKGFLSAEIFQHNEFNTLVAKPLKKGKEPERGAVGRIRQIMSAVMVKHRPGVINEEVHIPPSTLSVQKVPFTHWQQLTYNALTALVVSNVFTSNFEDQDYFLHPRNTESYNQVVTNLHLACTWFVSGTMDLEGAISRNLEFLEKKEKKGEVYPHHAGVLEANRHMREALDAPGWDEWMRNEPVSAPYEADMLPPPLLDAWSESADSQVPLIDAMSLKLLRELNSPRTSLSDLVRVGWEERAFHPRCQELFRIMERQEKLWMEGRAQAAPDLEHHRDDTKAAADRPKAPQLKTNAAKPKMMSGKRDKERKADPVIEDRLNEAERNAQLIARPVLGPRPLLSVVATSSRSAKINFVIRTVLTAPATDKFVMFGTFDEIAHMQEALSFVGVESVFAVQKLAPVLRNRAITDFAKPHIRVIFLELKFAARGLTLTLANRMIFLSPVWSLDVQAQAIKRIHRIGQTRPTHIDILVTEGTFEEDIVRREASMRSLLMEQSYTRALIENPRFVSTQHDEPSSFPIRLIPSGSELTADENEEFARIIASVAPPPSTANGTAATTPIVTPGTPQEIEMSETAVAVATDEPSGAKRHIYFDSESHAGTDTDTQTHTQPGPEPITEPEPARPTKRARFADVDE